MVCQAHPSPETRNGTLWGPARWHKDTSPKKTYFRRCPAEGIRGAWNWRRLLCPGGKTPPTWWESQLEESSSWRPGHGPLSCGHRDNACVESRLLCTCLRELGKSVADLVLEAKPCPGVAHTCRRRRSQSDRSSSVGGMKPLKNLTNVMNLLPRKTRILMQTQKSTNKFRAPGHNPPLVLHQT